MNLDDESHLSAYLDDELDPAERSAIEGSLESSPPLAGQLRAIASARELVAGLDRPTIPRDLAADLVARIAQDRPRVRLASIARPARLAALLSGFSAVAASLIFALIRLHPALHASPDPIVDAPEFVADAAPVSAPGSRPHPIATADLATPIPPTAAAPPVLARFEPVRPQPAGPRVAPPPLLAATSPTAVPAPQPPAKVSESAARRLVGEILGREHIRRVVIVTDVIDAPGRVLGLIAREAREAPEFGRISIRQEIAIDSDHAEPAEVFAVPIDERGRSSFVDRLRKAFPDLTEEGQADPELVAQLTEVGQVALLRGQEAAPLGDPPGHLPAFIANREATDRAPFLFEADRGPIDAARTGTLAIAAGPSRRPGFEGTVDGPAREFVGPPDSRRKPRPGPSERVTLLVWVTRPGRH